MEFGFVLDVRMQGGVPLDTIDRAIDGSELDARVDLAGGRCLLTVYIDAIGQEEAVGQLLDFIRSLRHAIASARIDDELVAVSDIAKRLMLTRQAVALFANPEHHFPQHVAVVASGRIWRWAEVNEWLRLHRPGRADAEHWPLCSDAHWINVLLMQALGDQDWDRVRTWVALSADHSG